MKLVRIIRTREEPVLGDSRVPIDMTPLTMEVFGKPLLRTALAEAAKLGRSTGPYKTIKYLPTPRLLPVPLQPTVHLRSLHSSLSVMSTLDKFQADLAGTWLGHRGTAAFDLRSKQLSSAPSPLWHIPAYITYILT